MKCWEYKKCGRDKTKDCPAYPFYGDSCWLAAGTLCGGKIQGTFAQKLGDCTRCDFYKVMYEGRIKKSVNNLKRYYG